MNDEQIEHFEAELRLVKLAEPPPALLTRIEKLRPVQKVQYSEQSSTHSEIISLSLLFRWLIPAAALLVAGLMVWRSGLLPFQDVSWLRSAAAPPPPVKADDVQIDQELITSFDAVAKMPDGEPVRFRCRKWMDNVVVSDRRSGLVLQERTPRFEVVPVGYETY